MKMSIFALAALVAFASLVGDAHAGVSFSYEGIAASGSSLSQAGSQTINLYLVETLTNGSSSVLAAEQGLFGAGVAVVVSGGGGSTITGVNGNTQAPPAGWNGPTMAGYNSTAAGILDAAGANQSSSGYPNFNTAGGFSTTSNGVTTNGVFLGSITINVAASGATTFTVESIPDAGSAVSGFQVAAGSDATYTNLNDYDLDSNSPGPAQPGSLYTYTGANQNPTSFIAGVPEPSSMALCGLALSGMGFGYWRRRRAKSAPEAEEAQTVVA